MKRYIYLAGGFGNNLFQICYGLHLERKGYQVIYKTFLLRKNVFTKILGWSIHSDEMIESLLIERDCDSNINLTDLFFLASSMMFKKIFKSSRYEIDDKTIKNKRYFGYCVKGEHLSDAIFSELRAQLISLNIEHAREHHNDCCCLHLRRGDFTDNHRLSVDYYLDAVEKIDGLKDINLVTDDPTIFDLIKERFDIKLNISQQSSMKGDFFELFNSKTVIMSNSTFCYWAVVLGNADFVVSPNRISTTVPWLFHLNKKFESIDCLFESENK